MCSADVHRADNRNQDSSEVLQYRRDEDQVSPVITESELRYRKPSLVCFEVRSVCVRHAHSDTLKSQQRLQSVQLGFMY